MKSKKCLTIYFISGFPTFLTSFSQHSIVKKAIAGGKVKIINLDLRQFGVGKHKQIDDYQYGPGKGMVLRVEPIAAALKAVKAKLQQRQTLIILLSPQGKVFDQATAAKLAQTYDDLVFIAGHYEGFDERIRQLVDQEISLGDYVLTNGELSAMVVADAIIRLRPDVIQTESRMNESFSQNLLDHPVYTKPIIFEGKKVPPVLLSGHHAQIATWRRKQALIKTAQKRPDLLKKRQLTNEEKKLLKKLNLLPGVITNAEDE